VRRGRGVCPVIIYNKKFKMPTRICVWFYNGIGGCYISVSFLFFLGRARKSRWLVSWWGALFNCDLDIVACTDGVRLKVYAQLSTLFIRYIYSRKGALSFQNYLNS